QSGAAFLSRLEIQDNGSEPEPCLIFLDLRMAPMTGLEVLGRWKSSRLAQHSIVVMISGLRDLKAIQDGYQAGAKTFLIKPVTKDDFLQTLSALRQEITVAEVQNGYALHWKKRDEPREVAESSAKPVRIMTLSI